MINICAGPILLILYISVHQINILETSFFTSIFFFLSQGCKWKKGEFRDIASPVLLLASTKMTLKMDSTGGLVSAALA